MTSPSRRPRASALLCRPWRPRSAAARARPTKPPSTRRSATWSATPRRPPRQRRPISVPGNGFIGAAFRHRTSRAGDPQLHTHVLVANMTRGPDGRWTALDGPPPLPPRQHRRLPLPGQASGRSSRAGSASNGRRSGAASPTSTASPPRCLRAFSRRRSEIEQPSSRSAASTPAGAAQVAALAHPPERRTTPSRSTSFANSGRTRRALDFAPEHVAALPDHSALDAPDPGRSPDGHEAPRRRRRPHRPSLHLHPSRCRPRVVRAAPRWRRPRGRGARRRPPRKHEAVAPAADVDTATTVGDVIRRADGRIVAPAAMSAATPPPSCSRSSPDLSTRARAAATRDRDASPRHSPNAPSPLAPELSDEQADMVRDGSHRTATRSPSSSARPARARPSRSTPPPEAWQAQGYRGHRRGARPPRRSRAAATAPASTRRAVAALLADLRDYGLQMSAVAPTVIVIDEAGMVGTRQLAELFDHAIPLGIEARAWSATIASCPRSMPVERSAALTRLPPIELAHNRRQDQRGSEKPSSSSARPSRGRDRALPLT